MPIAGRVGIESRDWHREPPKRRRRPSTGFLVVLSLGVAAALALSPPVATRLGYGSPFLRDDGVGSGSERVAVFPGGPGFTLGHTRLYAADDPWQRWLADEATCPGGEQATASAQAKVQTMLCLVNYARGQQGVGPLRLARFFNYTATVKAGDIARCHQFAHEACGRAMNQAAFDAGYRGAMGENLYIGEGALGLPRSHSTAGSTRPSTARTSSDPIGVSPGSRCSRRRTWTASSKDWSGSTSSPTAESEVIRGPIACGHGVTAVRASRERFVPAAPGGHPRARVPGSHARVRA